MKLTQLKIGARNEWGSQPEDRQMICTVKLESEKTTVETVLSDGDVQRVLDLIREVVSAAAERNVSAFVAAARAIEAVPERVLL